MQRPLCWIPGADQQDVIVGATALLGDVCEIETGLPNLSHQRCGLSSEESL